MNYRNGRLLFIKPKCDENCVYRMFFGNRSICNCPPRNEIYDRYGIRRFQQLIFGLASSKTSSLTNFPFFLKFTYAFQIWEKGWGKERCVLSRKLRRKRFLMWTWESETQLEAEPRFRFQDFYYLEKTPTSPHSIRNEISDLIFCSTWKKAEVDSTNPNIGQYRIILTGTSEKEGGKWDEL